MAAYQVIRGDTYALRRPLFTYTIVDEDGVALDLSGCTVRTTWKTAATDPNTDTTDAEAVLTGTLIVDVTGVATTETNLYLIGAAADGTVQHRVSSADTLALPLATSWTSDVEVIDANGEVFTVLFSGDTLSATDGITNRTSG